MITYKCDIGLEFDDRNPQFLINQLFSVTGETVTEELQEAIEAYYKTTAGAAKVYLSSYQLYNK